MKRKLLEVSLVVFCASTLIKTFIWLRPWRLPLPHEFAPANNAIMLLAAAFSLILALSIMLPRINYRILVYTAIAIFGLVASALIFHAVHGSNQPAPQVTWDDGRK